MQTAVDAPRPRHGFRNFVLVMLLLCAAYGAGYIPEHLERKRADESLAMLTRTDDLSELHRQLGVASHEAMRNNYASAAEAAKVFFDGCREFLEKYPLDDQPRTKATLQTWIAQRDSIMARLAAADPSSREQLAGMFLAMNGVIERKQ